jgi:hypothetical protein
MANLATWFTPSLQTISRSSGRSSVLAAAYRACTKLTDERIGKTTDYTPKGKHGLAGNICIGIPNDDIGKLWNDAEKSETRVNSTVARELMVPLSAEWSDHERRECVRAIAQMLRDEYGVAVLASIHRPSRDNNNDHAHILFTTRTVDANGEFGKKTRILDDAKTGEVKRMRESICAIVNKHAIANGSAWYVYAGKFSDIIQDHIPTKHISIKAGKNQKNRIDANRAEVKEAYAELEKIRIDERAIAAQIKELTAVAESSYNTAPTLEDTSAGVLVVRTRGQVLERLRSHPEMAKYVEDAATNEELLKVLIEEEPKIILRRKAVEEFEAKRLNPIPMPAEAQKARLQIENAIFSRQTLRQQLNAWQAMHEKLLVQPPTPEYGFFGRPKASYKEALAEHHKALELAKGGITECNSKAAALIAYIYHPERQQLHNVYKETMTHNRQVELQEMEIAQKQQLWRAQSEQERAQRENEANRVDWLASLNKSGHGMKTRRERVTPTEYGSGGMGM